MKKIVIKDKYSEIEKIFEVFTGHLTERIDEIGMYTKLNLTTIKIDEQ